MTQNFQKIKSCLSLSVPSIGPELVPKSTIVFSRCLKFLEQLPRKVVTAPNIESMKNRLVKFEQNKKLYNYDHIKKTGATINRTHGFIVNSFSHCCSVLICWNWFVYLLWIRRAGDQLHVSFNGLYK